MKTHKLTNRLLSLALCICMVLSMLPAMVLFAQPVQAATTATYISRIAVAMDKSLGNAGHEDAKKELTSAGFTVFSGNLNQNTGGLAKIYMGYKTTTNPDEAITGFRFWGGAKDNAPDTITHEGSTFYILGGAVEPNAGDGKVDLNATAGGNYLYIYVTRDPEYGSPITSVMISSNLYENDHQVADNVDMNGAGSAMYLLIKRYSQWLEGTIYYYDNSSGVGKRLTDTFSGYIGDHTKRLTLNLSMATAKVSMLGKEYRWFNNGAYVTYVGWRDDTTAGPPEYTSSNLPYLTVDTPGQTFCCVYKRQLYLGYSGKNMPAKQYQDQYYNVGISSYSIQNVTFTISNEIPNDPAYCEFLGWQRNGDATVYKPGGSITINADTYLSPVWKEHTGDICSVCGASTDAPSQTDSIYYISNKAELIWFMQYVNQGNPGANAILTANIDMSGYNWTPIGSTGLYYNTTSYSDKGYTGTFDGNGYVIKNLAVTGSTTADASFGLFGTLSGTVKNLGMENFKYTGAGKDSRVGAIVGQMLPGSKVENCYVSGVNINTKVNTTNGVAGGIAGCNYAGTISSSYSYNVTISAGRDGGIVGDNRGDISTTDRKGTLTNCYTNYSKLNHSDRPGTTSACGTLSNAQFQSGEATWKLNGSSSSGAWKQTVGTGLPKLSGKTVNYGYTSCNPSATKVYTNATAYATKPGHTPAADDGDCTTEVVCTVCGTVTTAQKDKHDVSYTNNGATHTESCSVCDYEVIENHTYTNGFCVCGAADLEVVVASTTIGGNTTYYLTLDAAIQAVKNCTASDNAVVKLMKDIDLGSDGQTITSGVFTLDLNGKTLSSSYLVTLLIYGSGSNVTITDSGNGGTISGNVGIYTMDSTLTVNGGRIQVANMGLQLDGDATATINGGTISGNSIAIYTTDDCTLTVNGGRIDGKYGITGYLSTLIINGGTIIAFSTAVAVGSVNVTISGGSIRSTDQVDIDGPVTLILGEDGVGATFPYGITITGATLKDILGEGAAYWQGDKQINPADGATEITGGDVTIKAACPHKASKTNYIDLKDGVNHTCYCSGCSNIIIEGHSYTNGLCVCGAMISDAVASVSKNGVVTGAYTILNDAIQAVKNCTADDNAVVKLLKDIDLGSSYQTIRSGVFTLDLNGKTLSSTGDYGLYLYGKGVDVTVTDSGTGGTISGADCGVHAHNSTVTISGGSISGGSSGVDVSDSTVTISGGSISGDHVDIYNNASIITLTLGENGVGATFPGGISVYGTTLNEILGSSAAYWQGSKQRFPADYAEEITGGDVIIKAYVAPSGWTQIGDIWYYYDPDTNIPVTGVSRVPYPTESINGVTYAPNAEDIAYYENKGQTFIDKETAFFVFDENGVFQSDQNGLTGDNRWAVNGHIAWHAGLVQIGEDYYYFIGDVDNGGNKIATGDVYAHRNTTDFDMTVGGVYTFGTDGKLCKYEGITEVNGVLRYYENAQLMLGKGLIYVETTGGTCSVTLESHNDNKLNIIKVVREHLGLGLKDAKDLVESAPVLLSSTLTKDQADALMTALKNAGGTATMLAPGYRYVTSDGSLVVNANYWVANTNGYNVVVGAYDFDENGLLIEPRPSDKNGVYFENGAWYYYENGKIAYNKGLISVNTSWHGEGGSENVYSGYIYVRSSGKLATGEYYITNVSDGYGMFRLGQKVSFSELGIADAPKHGIVDVDGTLYFYQYGQIQYNAGLIEHNGGWIYVRSNGKLATGTYWITNTNGNLDAGMYEFGEDGYLVITDTEDGIIDENGVLYYYEDGKKLYGTGLRQLEDGSYIYIRTNGQLAVGSYWITNHNGLLPEGMYTFDEDGILIEN